MDAGFRITTVVFFTPEGEKVMTVNDAHKKGYWVGNSPTRLVQRVPSAAPEIFTHNVSKCTSISNSWLLNLSKKSTLPSQVAGVPMRVFKTSTIFEKTWLATQIDAAAACPLQEGNCPLLYPLVRLGVHSSLCFQFKLGGRHPNLEIGELKLLSVQEVCSSLEARLPGTCPDTSTQWSRRNSSRCWRFTLG